MSRIRADRLTDKAGTGAPILVNGVSVTGQSTLNDVVGAAVTFNSVDSNGDINAKGNIVGDNATNISGINDITAVNVSASGNFTGNVNNTPNLLLQTGGGERVRIGPAGQIGLSGANYGASGQVLTSGGAGANASWTTISSAPEHTGIASGSITAGRTVCVADDGKILPVTGYNEATGTDTQIVDNTNYFDIVYSTAADKYVFFYRDEADGNKGKARVGTQSGTTITWGSAVQFTANSPLYIQALYDSTNDKVVVLYQDGGNASRGSVCVGSLSGSTLTFGTPVQNVTGLESGGGGSLEYPTFCYCPTSDNYAVIWNSSSGNKGWCRIGKYSGTNSSSWPYEPTQFLNGQARESGAWYDTTVNKLMIATNDGNDSNHTKLYGGTVANDTFTVTNSGEFSADGTSKEIEGCHDSTTGKNVIVFCGTSNYGQALTAVPDGGSGFTFGTIYNFNHGTTGRVGIQYNPAADKFLIVYADGSNVDYPKSIITTLTGNVLTFDTPHVIGAYNADTTRSSLIFNPDTYSFVACFRKSGAANYYIQNIRVSNLTAGNYIGIANASYTNGQTASIATPGAICDAVSGLTVGTRYYADAEGTFVTTPDSQNIIVGNSVATNKMIVR